MNELLIFKEAKSGEKVGIYYNAWLFIMMNSMRIV